MTNCIICNNSDFELIYNNTLKKCTACNFITANIDISNDELNKIYSENYFKGEEYSDYVKDKDSLQCNFNKRLNYIFKKFNENDIKSVLEIGCAYGFFAETINSRLKNIKYIGIDIVTEAIEYGKNEFNQHLELADYLNYNTNNKYSDIFMWDVIEHLQYPELYIKKAYDELSDAGKIYITTGDIDRFIPRIKKHKWRMIHPPSHLHYFSAKTISKLLCNNGFTIESITYPYIYRSVKQIFYSLFMLNKKPRKITNSIYKSIPNKLKVPINTYDIMFVIAKKRGK